MNKFVPKHLGLAHIDRTKVIQEHTAAFRRVIFDESKTDVAVTVDDGTYIYIEKSGDHFFKGDHIRCTRVVLAFLFTFLGHYLAERE